MILEWFWRNCFIFYEIFWMWRPLLKIPCTIECNDFRLEIDFWVTSNLKEIPLFLHHRYRRKQLYREPPKFLLDRFDNIAAGNLFFFQVFVTITFSCKNRVLSCQHEFVKSIILFILIRIFVSGSGGRSSRIFFVVFTLSCDRWRPTTFFALFTSFLTPLKIVHAVKHKTAGRSIRSRGKKTTTPSTKSALPKTAPTPQIWLHYMQRVQLQWQRLQQL